MTASGTRNAQRLFSQDEYRQIVRLRRWLAQKDLQDAVLALHTLMDKYPTNEALLARLARI